MTAQTSMPGRSHFRSLWISDVHIGTYSCRARQLLDFLESCRVETLYLVGDIIDGWSLKRSWRLPPEQQALIRKVLNMAALGTRVIYVPGNHDEFARLYPGLTLSGGVPGLGAALIQGSGIQVCPEAIHTTPDGRRLLVTHGDLQEQAARKATPLSILGSWAYDIALGLNNVTGAVRRSLGLPYWPVASELKRLLPVGEKYVGDYRRILLADARSRGLDGVICGHIHQADLRMEDGMIYANTGDWVDACSALAEHFTGMLHLLHWREAQRQPEFAPALAT